MCLRSFVNHGFIIRIITTDETMKEKNTRRRRSTKTVCYRLFFDDVEEVYNPAYVLLSCVCCVFISFFIFAAACEAFIEG